jgi:DNA primase
VMMAIQFNLGPAVATLGTAMTEEHMRALKRFDLPIYLVYDGDRAGRQAMERALPFILKLGLEAKAITLPQGQDPADFLLNTEDWPAKWQELKDSSLDVFDYKMEMLIQEKGIEQSEHKVSIAKTMLSDLKLNRDPIRKGVYLKSMADRLDVGVKDLEEQLNLSEKKEVVNLQFQKPSTHFKKDAPFYLLAVTLVDKFDFVTPLEELNNLPFYSSPTAKVLEKWLDAHATPGAVSHDLVMAKLTEIEREIFSEARIAELPMELDDIKALFEEQLKAWTNDKQSLDQISGQIKKAEKEGNFEEVTRLVKLKANALKK